MEEKLERLKKHDIVKKWLAEYDTYGEVDYTPEFLLPMAYAIYEQSRCDWLSDPVKRLVLNYFAQEWELANHQVRDGLVDLMADFTQQVKGITPNTRGDVLLSRLLECKIPVKDAAASWCDFTEAELLSADSYDAKKHGYFLTAEPSFCMSDNELKGKKYVSPATKLTAERLTVIDVIHSGLLSHLVHRLYLAKYVVDKASKYVGNPVDPAEDQVRHFLLRYMKLPANTAAAVLANIKQDSNFRPVDDYCTLLNYNQSICGRLDDQVFFFDLSLYESAEAFLISRELLALEAVLDPSEGYTEELKDQMNGFGNTSEGAARAAECWYRHMAENPTEEEVALRKGLAENYFACLAKEAVPAKIC